MPDESETRTSGYRDFTCTVTIAHAFEIAQLTRDDQWSALAQCFPPNRTTATQLKDTKAEAATVRELREWIECEAHLDLTDAPFDTQDEALLLITRGCARCPKRTGTNPLLFLEVGQKKSICTDRQYYRAKVEALVQLGVKPLEESGDKPLRVSQVPAWQAKNGKPDVLYEGQYRPAQKKAEGPQTKLAVVIDGPEAGKLLLLCRDEKCPVHAKTTRYQPTPQERAEEALAKRIEKLTRFRILNAIRKELPPTVSRPDFELAARDYFERLGYDNHRRLCRVYGWEEKKTKAAWGGNTVDYKTTAAEALGGMSTQQIHHFLVVCALASDLYCPGYNPSQTLGKDSNLAQTAALYKIDTARLSTMVREEIAEPPEGTTLKKNKATKLKSNQETIRLQPGSRR